MNHTRPRADRSHIDIGDPHAILFWSRHLGVSAEELLQAIGKVGDSAMTVRKELRARTEP